MSGWGVEPWHREILAAVATEVKVIGAPARSSSRSAEQRGHLEDIEPGPGPVDCGVEDGLHLPAGAEQQVTAVWDLQLSGVTSPWFGIVPGRN